MRRTRIGIKGRGKPEDYYAVERDNSNVIAMPTPESSAFSEEFNIARELDSVLYTLGIVAAETGGKIEFVGKDPIVPSPHRLGAIVGLPLMAAAVGTAIVWRMKTGAGQDLSLDLRRAVHAINPYFRFRPTINGHVPNPHDAVGDPFATAFYLTRDNRWVLLESGYTKQSHNLFPLLRCSIDNRSIANAILQWYAFDLEEAAAERDFVLAVARTPQEWLDHPQGQLLAQTPVIEIEKIGESPSEAFFYGPRPLSGARVLCATHAISGSVVGRTLAEQGADVLHIASPANFEHDLIWAEANVGMRSAWLDIKNSEDNRRLQDLCRDADVFVENFRGRALSQQGFSPEELANKRPGIVYVSIRCYGYSGPWSGRGGYDPEAFCAAGNAVIEGRHDMPRLPVTRIINDFVAGYFGAAAVTATLIRRAREGGSYHIRISLARNCMWYQSLGLLNKGNLNLAGEEHQLLEPESIVRPTSLGELHRMAPPVRFSETTGYWEDPILVPRGSSKAEWSMQQIS